MSSSKDNDQDSLYETIIKVEPDVTKLIADIENIKKETKKWMEVTEKWRVVSEMWREDAKRSQENVKKCMIMVENCRAECILEMENRRNEIKKCKNEIETLKEELKIHHYFMPCPLPLFEETKIIKPVATPAAAESVISLFFRCVYKKTYETFFMPYKLFTRAFGGVLWRKI